MSVTKGVGQSKHLPSSSVIGTLMSKISLSQASTSHDADNSRISDNCSGVQTFDATSPIILPSVLSEYRRLHINQNRLRRCIQWKRATELQRAMLCEKLLRQVELLIWMYVQEVLSALSEKRICTKWMHVGILLYAFRRLCLHRQATGFHLLNWEQT
ncbi:uncharacterized protein K444DRAFT_317933 [Hyaloscypha bicolor E]|uniref:Uncharacterized protein n=1 Tax=Hyaloscypha bicolor E TaxID=1095630 RepID=A0A2J6TL77_9HELO|nr:uncharacterized protein K444DRAFT_317933 [Hyaloscypha bicolor E]PMD63769.1 hypothetical protein K444DRAFT_317933 [Hyaloscypha bicolor E]